MFKIPILFLCYNRPKITNKTLKRIISYKPNKIYISVDGPKNDPKDRLKVTKVKNIINNLRKKNIKIIKKINLKNLGCKQSNLKAINWFFKNEKMGIIIEDDCLIEKDFLKFCKIMLEKYKYNKKIFCISGSNFQHKKIQKESYYYSKYNHCWGWATWRDRWRFNNSEITFWPKFKNSEQWNKLHQDNIEKKFWNKIFDNVFKNNIDSWAYPWTLSVWKKKGITVTPTSNLVKNIGFGYESTHSVFLDKKLNYLNKSKLEKKFIYPRKIEINHTADQFVFVNHFKGKNYIFPYRIIFLLQKLISNPIAVFQRFAWILDKKR